ncbi:MAG TPA: asparaginase [Kineosporiaceae bacterium]|nr:asparaginase [Kineosporiaceae bacterium]
MIVAPLAYVTRSGFVEGVHHGTAVALDPDGGTVLTHGDPAAPMLPRSALKPLQLLAMLRAGLQLDGELLALAAASHSGEAFHLDGVDRILGAAGLTEQMLQNVEDLPLGQHERLRWQRESRSATRRAHNCSGKHSAMLATCRQNGWPEATYLEPDHPLQRLVVDTVAELAGEPVAATAVDGCGAPALAISLTGLARAFGRLAGAAPDTHEGRIASAVREYPQWLGGTDREVTELIRGVPGLIAKDGAEAVYAAALPDGRAVAFKIADGSTRALQVVMVALLRRLGIEEPTMTAMATVSILGHGRPVGAVVPAVL